MILAKNEFYKILLVDDNLSALSFVETAMKKEGYEIKTCNNGDTALSIIKNWTPHLVILDVNMPGMSGLDVLKEIRSYKEDGYISVILVTANSELHEITLGLDLGADDYVIKPFKIRELQARVRSALRVKVLQDDLIKKNRQLREMTTRDDLTKLRNMGFTLSETEKAIERAKEEGSFLSCIMFDMDNFKKVNDYKGHLIGSKLLVEISDIIRSVVRPSDIPARFGGDEFFIMLPNTTISKAHEIADEIRKKISDKNFEFESSEIKVTASFGIAGVETKLELGYITAKMLVKSADDALYVAKNKGKDRVETGLVVSNII